MRYLRSSAFICGMVLLFSSIASADEIKVIRHPSYHAGKIAFSYAGDIWVVNEDGSNPRRITDNRAREVYPRFSPDGKWIAFSSNRNGNYDVFIVPSTGGKVKQLTFHSGSDEVVGWSADGKKVIFRAARNGVFPGVATLFEVSVDGGLEQPMNLDWGYFGAYSPDGKLFAFNRHPSVWWRQHYRGSYSADLWVEDVAAKTFKKLLPEEQQGANSFWPMFGTGNEIFFVTDRTNAEKGLKFGGPEVMKSVNNIWKIPAGGGKPVQVTHHTDGRVFWPSASSDGKVIVYEEDFGLWKLDTATGQTHQIKVNLDTDDKENNDETITVNNEADHFSLSPSGRRAVISTRGSLFTIATERGDVTPLAAAPWRQTVPQWSPDGKWIAFISDRSGQEEIWICDQSSEKLKKLTTAATEKGEPVWSPDSAYLLFSDSERNLNRVSIADGKVNVVATAKANLPQGYSFSPDGKWVSFTRPGVDQRAHVYVASAAGGEEHRIDSDDVYSSTGAAWTRDGKALLYVAGGTPGGGIASVGGAAGATSDLMIVSTTHLDKNPADRDVDEEEPLPAAAAGGAGRGGAGAAADRMPEVKFDWDGIERRGRRLQEMTGGIGNIVSSPDGRSAAFTNGGGGGGGRGGAGAGGGAALYTVSVDTGTLTRIPTPTPQAPAAGEAPAAGGGFGGGISNIAWSRDGRTLYFRSGRGIYSSPVGGGNAAAAPAAAAPAGGRGGRGGAGAAPTTTAAAATGEARRINFTVKIELDKRAERTEIFEESWRVMKHRFYDANMHGADWNKAKGIYEPLLHDVYDKEEMSNVILQMIGEMNASHTGFTPNLGTQRELQTRYPGFDLAADPAGYYKVSYIYRDGPADHEYVKIRKGDYIIAIDDEEVKSGENYWKNLTIAPGRKFKFLVNDKPSREGAWDVRVEPINQGAFTTLQYEKWVRDRREMVEKASNGEIGYVHIRAMDEPSLRRFERELAENHAKKALIIDQRFNGGGGIDQELLQILSQRTRYQYTRNRNSEVDVDRPLRAFFGPMVVMENERSASDAEMFPKGFKDLKLGLVVGVHTYGAVIGTGSYTLVDGSTIRTPGSGVWAMGGQNMENYGVPPDVYVDNTPSDFLAGRDRQVEKAVEVLKGQLALGHKE